MIIAIDFDGTCVKHAFPKIGESIGAEPVLKALVKNGHKLILWTMRSNVTAPRRPEDEPEIDILDEPGNYLDDAVNWFRERDIPLYAVQRNPTQDSWTSSPKCYAEMYIDDAALGMTNVVHTKERPYVSWPMVMQMVLDRRLITEDDALLIQNEHIRTGICWIDNDGSVCTRRGRIALDASEFEFPRGTYCSSGVA